MIAYEVWNKGKHLTYDSLHQALLVKQALEILGGQLKVTVKERSLDD